MKILIANHLEINLINNINSYKTLIGKGSFKMKIAHISDLHFTTFFKKNNLERIKHLLNYAETL